MSGATVLVEVLVGPSGVFKVKQRVKNVSRPLAVSPQKSFITLSSGAVLQFHSFFAALSFGGIAS
jgi:hypothetical protein